MVRQNSYVFILPLWMKIVGLLVPIIIIIVNSIEIHLLRKTLNKQSYEKVLLSLSVCDLVSGLITLTAVPYMSLVHNEFYVALYWIIWRFVFCYWNLTTMLHLIIIGIDRLWAIGAPFHHRIHSSHRKLVVSVGLAWFLPMIFVAVNIVSFSTQRFAFDMSYIYIETLMYSTVARIIIIVDIVLIFCYCAIMCMISKRDRKVNHNKQSNQANSMNTFILCIGIVSVFIVSTTPFVAIHVTMLERPEWLESLSKFVISLNQIWNSLVYFLQNYRKNKRPVKALRRNSQEPMESNNTRLQLTATIVKPI